MIKKSLTAVIVDDDSMVRDILRLTLKSLGIIVIGEANDTSKAKTLLETETPDLMFLDIVMPGESGFSVLRELKEKNSSTRVIMISAESSIENVKKAITQGAKGYVVKPFTPDKVVSAIKQAIPGFKAA